MLARDIMSKVVYTVYPDDPLSKVVKLICIHRISGVPVVDRRGRLVGLVSERDVLEAMYPNRPELRPEKRGKRQVHRQIRDIRRLPVRDVMIREVVTAPPDADPLRLASLLAIRRIRRIPIVEDGKLVGIVSQGDVYQAIFQKDWRPVRQHPVPEGAGHETQAEGKKPGKEKKLREPAGHLSPPSKPEPTGARMEPEKGSPRGRETIRSAISAPDGVQPDPRQRQRG